MSPDDCNECPKIAQARKEGYAEGAASSPKFKLLESIPDKNGFVIFGAKEDPEGHFVSREKAIEFMLIKDREIEQKIAQAAAAERERVLPLLERLATAFHDYEMDVADYDFPAPPKHRRLMDDLQEMIDSLRSQPEKQQGRS